MYDASRFARMFAHHIEEHPLLVYMSLLSFTPIHTKRQVYHDRSGCVSVVAGLEESWLPVMLVLTGHIGRVTSVVFSYDGSGIVSGSHIIQVSDSMSGENVLPAFVPQPSLGHINSMAFSPDGTMIAVASQFTSIRLWEISFAAELAAMHGHTKSVNSIAFSPDGTIIVSASDDTTGNTVWPSLVFSFDRTRRPCSFHPIFRNWR